MIKINYGNYKKYFYISVSFKTHCKRLEEGCFVNILRPFFTSISRLHSLVSSTVFPPLLQSLDFITVKRFQVIFFLSSWTLSKNAKKQFNAVGILKN
jgi:hypothetical protein